MSNTDVGAIEWYLLYLSSDCQKQISRASLFEDVIYSYIRLRPRTLNCNKLASKAFYKKFIWNIYMFCFIISVSMIFIFLSASRCYYSYRRVKRGYIVLRYFVPLFPSVLSVDWRNSRTRFAPTPERKK